MSDLTGLRQSLDGIACPEEYLPFHRPSIGAAEEDAVLEVLRSGWLARGARTARFEEEFADFVGAGHAVALNSCTAGLHLALLAAGVGPGDEVITTPFTFAATANTIIHSGATPVFADIDPGTLNIDPIRVEACLTENTRAIIPVHYGGRPCDMAAIGELASARGITVIEDAAHALGASVGESRIGSISDFTAFSFYATKNITTGEGGMLTTDDEALAREVRMLSQHGMSSDAWKRYSREGHSYYEVERPGFKYNMSDLPAAIGIEQLRRSDELATRRRELAAVYEDSLRGCPNLTVFDGTSLAGHAHHLFVVRLRTDRLRASRDEIAAAMEKLNVGVSVHFRSLHLHPWYRDRFGFGPEDFPEAAGASGSVLSLPLYPDLSDSDAAMVADTLKSLLEHFAADGDTA